MGDAPEDNPESDDDGCTHAQSHTHLPADPEDAEGGSEPVRFEVNDLPVGTPISASDWSEQLHRAVFDYWDLVDVHRPLDSESAEVVEAIISALSYVVLDPRGDVVRYLQPDLAFRARARTWLDRMRQLVDELVAAASIREDAPDARSRFRERVRLVVGRLQDATSPLLLDINRALAELKTNVEAELAFNQSFTAVGIADEIRLHFEGEAADHQRSSGRWFIVLMTSIIIAIMITFVFGYGVPGLDAGGANIDVGRFDRGWWELIPSARAITTTVMIALVLLITRIAAHQHRVSRECARDARRRGTLSATLASMIQIREAHDRDQRDSWITPLAIENVLAEVVSPMSSAAKGIVGDSRDDSVHSVQTLLNELSRLAETAGKRG